MTIQPVIDYLEAWAPRPYQENYDNSGLLTGQASWPLSGVLVTLDCTEAVVEEAIREECNLIIAHHPIVFKGLKKITGQGYVERTIIKAIKNDIAIYAIHTNLDNIRTGVNKKIADKIGLQNQRILAPRKDTLAKLVTFIPADHAEAVMEALHAAGAGHIGNYQDCSFRVEGTGTFRPNAEANPFLGEAGQLEKVQEVRAEVIFPWHQQSKILNALRQAHPYEEVAYYLTKLENENQEVGAGMLGTLETPEEPLAFLKRLKDVFQAGCIRYSPLPGRPIHKVAVCGGAGSFLLPDAIRAGADVLVTADFKYHEFFDAEGKLMVADVGHYESEHFTKELIAEVLREKFPTFAINFSKQVTNPLSYL